MLTTYQVGRKFTKNYEGFYANDPGDKGGETVRGISRVMHPESAIWPIFDALVAGGMSNDDAAHSPSLDQPTDDFYRKDVWDGIRGDELPGKLAVATFDLAFNSGVGQSILLMQRALGVSDDGIIGQGTLAAAHASSEAAVEELMARRMAFLANIILGNPDQKKWAMNWFRRCARLCGIVLEGQGPELSPEVTS